MITATVTALPVAKFIFIVRCSGRTETVITTPVTKFIFIVRCSGRTETVIRMPETKFILIRISCRRKETVIRTNKNLYKRKNFLFIITPPAMKGTVNLYIKCILTVTQ